MKESGRGTDDQIRILCRKLLRTGNPAEVQSLSDELQKAIHAHVEALRLRLLSNLGVPPKSMID